MRTQGRVNAPVTPELKAWDCADCDPIEAWVPDESEVILWITLTIGMPGSPAADNFQVCVATPEGLRSPQGKLVRAKGSGRPPPIVLQSYSWVGVVAAIQARLDACVGSDWLAIQERLRQQFEWEYEGMR